MDRISGTAQAFVDMYVGDPSGVPPPIESGWVVYSLTQTGKLQHIGILSETNFGQMSLVFTVTDSVSEDSWLNMGPAYGEPGDIQPLKVTSIDANSGTLTCAAETAIQIIGGLPTGTSLYTVTQQGNISQVAFCNPQQQGAIALLMSINPTTTEAVWDTMNSASIKVASLSN